MNPLQTRLLEKQNNIVTQLFRRFRDEDLIMQGITDAYIRLENRSSEGVENVDLFLVTAVANNCLNLLRKDKRMATSERLALDEDFDLILPPVDPDYAGDNHEKYAMVAKCIERLPKKQKEVLNTFLMYGCVAEAAKRNGRNVNTNKANFLFAKRKLKEMLIALDFQNKF